ncbi:MAG: DUF169 domain-containing protein [Coriobacteriales bacterium]|jgi:uncharacterized protein (DUF169 family)
MVIPNDYDALDLVGLEDSPVGVKFDFFRPKNIDHYEQGDDPKSLCELLRASQVKDRAFYISHDDPQSCVGKIFLGMEPMTPFAESGQIGERLGVFDNSRNNAKLYPQISTFKEGDVNFVSFAPVKKMNFEPDVLVISTTPEKGEVIMRAATRSTGVAYQSKFTAVMGCTWLLIYPYLSGNINFVLPTMVHGLHGREVYPDPSTILISIPYNWIPTVLGNLKNMPIELEGHKSRQAYFSEFNGIMEDLEKEMKEI